jgi:hypothetical protein
MAPSWGMGPPSHLNFFYPELFQKEMLGVGGGEMEQRLKERTSRDCPTLGSIQTPTLLVMPRCACKREPCMAALWEALPALDWGRWRYLQPTIRPSLVEELEEGLKEPKGIANPQEEQCQLTGPPQSSQRLSHQPKSIHGLVCGPCYTSSRELLVWPQWEGLCFVLWRPDLQRGGC